MSYRVTFLDDSLKERLIWGSETPSDTRIIAKAKLIRQVNDVDSFSFDVRETHPLYSELIPYNGYVVVRKNDKIVFLGKIITAPDNVRHTKSVSCDGGLALLKFSQYSRYMPNWVRNRVHDTRISNFSVTDTVEAMVNRVLDIHNAQVFLGGERQWDESFPCVTLGVCTARENPYGVDLTKSAGNTGTQDEGLYIKRDQTSFVTTYDWLMNEVADKCAAYIQLEVQDDFSLVLNIYGARTLPADLQTSVRFSKNLLDMSLETDVSELCTVFLPIGESNSNVGTLQGNAIDVAVQEAGEEITKSLSFGGILDLLFNTDDTIEDLSEVGDNILNASTTMTSTETVYNTIEKNGSAEETAEDIGYIINQTQKYTDRADKNYEIIAPSEDGAMMLVYYHQDDDEVMTDNLAVFTTFVDGWANEDTYEIYDTRPVGVDVVSVRYPIYALMENVFFADIDATSASSAERMRSTFEGLLQDSAASIRYYRPKYADKKLGFKQYTVTRTKYAEDPDSDVYKATISKSSTTEESDVLRMIYTDFKNISSESGGRYDVDSVVQASSSLRILFKNNKDKDKNTSGRYAEADKDVHFYLALKSSNYSAYTTFYGEYYDSTVYGGFDTELLNHLFYLNKNQSLTIQSKRLPNDQPLSGHLMLANVGSTGTGNMGFVELSGNDDVVDNASEDGITIEADYPFLIWREGLEKFGRIVKTHTWSSARRSQLRQYAPSYFKQKILESKTITVNATDLGIYTIDVGKSYKIICEPMGVKQWYPCLRSEEHLMDLSKTKYTFTYKRPVFTAEVRKVADSVSKANRRLPPVESCWVSGTKI